MTHNNLATGKITCFKFVFITAMTDHKFNRKLSVSKSVNRQLAVSFVFIGLQDLFIHRCEKSLTFFFKLVEWIEMNCNAVNIRECGEN